MTFIRFLLSSLLVSATFAICAYILFGSALAEPGNFNQRYGALYLALLPYFLGALLNKEGYWERSEPLDELLHPSEQKPKPRIFAHIVRVVFVLMLIGVVVVTRQVLGTEVVKGILLISLGAVWGAVIMRAWIIFQEGLTIGSSRRRR
mgnify:FL=1